MMEVVPENQIRKKTAENVQTMDAVCITAPGKATVEQIEIPEPKEGEVRIKLEGSGLCASNIPVWEGRDWFNYPIPHGNPGHEGWGIIDALGTDVDTLKIGDRVACLSFNAYATYDIANVEDVIVLPKFLDGKPFPGEPLGCAMNIFNRSDIQKGQTVAIVGAGFLGLLLLQLAKDAGAKVIVVSQREASLKAAMEAGADDCILMDDHYAIIEKVKNSTKDRFCERVIEATGKEWPLNLSIELTGERGKLIVAGFHQDGMRQVNMQLLNWRGIDMINAHERDSRQYVKGIRQAIKAIEDGRMNPFPFFTHTFPLDQASTAFSMLKERPDGFVKALLINT